MKAHKEIFALQAFVDERLDKLHSGSAAKGRPITCRGKGCFACCLEPVYASRQEIEHILGRLTPRQRDHVKDRLFIWLAKVEPSHLLDQETPNVFEWRALKAWCPFLENGACSVYHDRPTGCRMHNAVGNPDDCADDEKRRHQTYAISHELFAQFTAYTSAHFRKVENANLGTWLAKLLLDRDIEDGTMSILQFIHEKEKAKTDPARPEAVSGPAPARLPS